MAELEIQGTLQRRTSTSLNSQLMKNLYSLMQSPPAVFGLVVLLLVVVCAVFAPILAPYNPLTQNIPERLSPPDWSLALGSHFLGTDSLGRDILSRIIYGSRISLVVGLSSVVGAGVIGVLIGLVSGFYGDWVDHLLMRLVDVWMSIPFLVLAIAIVAVLGPSLENIIIVLAVTGWVQYSRIVRGQVLSTREETYVEAARVVGASNVRIMFLHVLPNVTNSIIVIATLQVAQMITSEAALSFLGLGVQPPTPAWGSMVAEGRDVISIAWWLSTFPGLAIVFTVLAINLLGDWLRQVLDPRLRM
jgi:peptide/nickel transport system permease protein